MCAAPNSPMPTSMQSNEKSSKPSTKPIPKWLKMKQQNKSSAGKQTAKPIAKQSLSSAQQKPSEGTRNEKRARWAKKSKPVARPVAAKVFRGPTNEYISACCSAPAQKPRAGMKETAKDPESGKMKEKPKGLGKWRCSQCKKVAKVTPRKPAPKEIVNAVRSINSASVVPVEEVPVVAPTA